MNGGPAVPEAAAFAFENAMRAISQRSALIDPADSKAGVILAADGVFAGLLFARGSIAVNAPRWIAISVAVSLVLSAGSALFALFPRVFAVGARSRSVADSVAGHPQLNSSAFQWWFLPNLLDGIDEDDRKLRRKVRSLRTAAFLLLGAVGLMASQFVDIILKGRG